MRRLFMFLIPWGLILLSCQAITLPVSHWRSKPIPTTIVTSSAPIITPSLSPFPVETIAIAPPTVIPKDPLTVIFHPDGGLFIGDQVSMEVIAPIDDDLQGSRVLVDIVQPISHSLQSADFAYFGLGKRVEANLTWAWDTTDLSPGDYTLNFSIQPNGAVWTQTVTLQPAGSLPPEELGARWVTAESECCLVYYITQTASERDISTLLEMLDEQSSDVSQAMQAEFIAPVTVAFIPRVLGHGGFTNQEITVSYLDRNYAGNTTEMILRHELTHILDGQLGGDLRPTFLVEGLAVYISGGHFKPEPLIPRAAVLLDNGQYIPFDNLIDDFYITPHEIGYLEAGALVEFMVNTWGWDEFSSFYRDIHPEPDDDLQSVAIEIALQKHFNVSLKTLEQRYLEVLKSQPDSLDYSQDVHLTVDYYNTLRRYQQLLDPSAYFLTAWIVNGKEMRARGITADYMRHPSDMNNLTLETMLQSAGDNLHSSNYTEAEKLISAINLVLAALERKDSAAFSGSSLAGDYYGVVEILTAQGYQPQRIVVNENNAVAWVTSNGQQLLELSFIRNEEVWELRE